MKTAYYLYDFHKKNDFKDLEIVQDLNEIKEHRVSTQSVNYFPHHAYLLIELGSESEDKLITLSARDSLNREVDLFKFNLVDYKDNRYMLRISNSYHWHQGTVKSLQFENYSGHKLPEIKSIKLLKDKRYEN